jgi:hypothetical protein
MLRALSSRRLKKAGISKRAASLAALAIVPAGTAAGFELTRREPSPSSGTKSVRFETTFDESRFLKGNVHAHTNLSDGDAAPEDVIGWYREHGYAFLAITDHNRLAQARNYPSLQDASFRLINGEEVSMYASGRQVHVNALCADVKIGGGTFSSSAEALAWATTRIASEGGVAIVNHPNFDRAIERTDLLSAAPASGIEIMSGHPHVYSLGRGDRPAHEDLWDYALSAGARVMGVGVDDVHHLRTDADPAAYPGSAWIEVFGDRNEPNALCGALRHGRFYSSNGATIRRLSVTSTTYSVWPGEPGASVRFIGRGGRVLDESDGLEAGALAHHVIHAGEGYVRVKVVDSDGTSAWAPAVFEAD